MKLSILADGMDQNYIVRIKNEKPFDRFAKVTDKVDGSTCVFISSIDYIKKIPNNAAMVITSSAIAEQIEDVPYGVCISTVPKATFYKCYNCYASKLTEKKPTAIGKNCIISPSAYIAPFNVSIGDNVVIEEFASIYENVTIGDNVTVRSGAKVGIEDYNYFEENGKMVQIIHTGSTVIKNDVVVGYNSVIGKALLKGDETIIDDNVQIGFNVCIGHDVHIGTHTSIYSGCVIGGHTTIGDNTHVTMNATVKNGLRIGNNVMICMGSNVIMNVKDGAKVFGNPAKKLSM